MSIDKPSRQLISDLTLQIKKAEFSYGNNGQLNVRLPKEDGETRKQHKERVTKFITDLAQVAGLDPKTEVVAHGDRGLIHNPEANLRSIMHALDLGKAALVFDKGEKIDLDGSDLRPAAAVRSAVWQDLGSRPIVGEHTGRLVAGDALSRAYSKPSR